MFETILRRNSRQPVAALAVLLFAAVLTVVLCHLHKTSEAERRSYEETYASVPVFFKVVDLDGSKPKDYTGINGWVVDLFDDDWLKPMLKPYVREIHVRVSLTGRYFLTDASGKKQERTQTTTGVSSTRVAEELTEGWGGKIYWNEGYDESILMTNEFVCIVPESMKEHQQLEMYYTYSYNPSGSMGDSIKKEITRTFQVVGYYTDPGNSRIYCPYETLVYIHGYIGKSKTIEEIGAILNDNTKLDALKADASQWFAKPNPMGEKTPWGRYSYEYYLYAMDFDDTMLNNLEADMKSSMRLNALASAAVFTLSAGAGFLTGFLVIRARKREIALMRTMGQPQKDIFKELALEQMLCIGLGIILGGSYGLWRPVLRLLLFACIYFVGLTAALIVFLRKNLLTTMKEDE